MADRRVGPIDRRQDRQIRHGLNRRMRDLHRMLRAADTTDPKAIKKLTEERDLMKQLLQLFRASDERPIFGVNIGIPDSIGRRAGDSPFRVIKGGLPALAVIDFGLDAEEAGQGPLVDAELRGRSMFKRAEERRRQQLMEEEMRNILP